MANSGVVNTGSGEVVINDSVVSGGGVVNTGSGSVTISGSVVGGKAKKKR